ncbi:MAG: hypothetical protein AAGD32_12845 [Planctomycetota bacterium]
MLASLLLCTLLVAQIGPQGEVIRDNARQMRAQGFLLLDGKWVEPQMTLAWSELVQFERRGSSVRLVPAMSDELLDRLKNNRRVLVSVGEGQTPFQLRARRHWITGRQAEGVWVQLQAVPQPTRDPRKWHIHVLHLDTRQFTLTAKRQVDDAEQQHVISQRHGNMIAAITTEAPVNVRQRRQIRDVMLRSARADLTALLAQADVDTERWAWEVLGLLSDAPQHPLRPLPGDLVEKSAGAPLLAEVRAILPRMLDRRGDERNAASADLAALGPDALPAVLHLLDGDLLPEQRIRLEGFVGEHSIYRDDAIDAVRVRAMYER